MGSVTGWFKDCNKAVIEVGLKIDGSCDWGYQTCLAVVQCGLVAGC